MTHDYLFDFNVSLGNSVRNYLLQPQNRRISEDEYLRPVCDRLAHLLGQLLKTRDGWGPYKWVDAIIPCTAEKVSKNDLEFTGLVIWGTRGTTKEWIDPLYASIHLSNSSSQFVEYKLLFGNTILGLGKCPYGSSQDYPQIPVTEWMFTLVSPSEVGER